MGAISIVCVTGAPQSALVATNAETAAHALVQARYVRSAKLKVVTDALVRTNAKSVMSGLAADTAGKKNCSSAASVNRAHRL
jgi:hypothetical protein